MQHDPYEDEISRRWIFHLIKPGRLLLKSSTLQHWGASYIVYQAEITESGSTIWIGYVELPRAVTKHHFMPKLQGAQMVRARSDPQACRAYCTKDVHRVHGPYEIGRIGQTKSALCIQARIVDTDTEEEEDNM